MKNVLFVCVENSCRSQIAEAFAKMHGAEIMNAYSSGSQPSGKVNDKAVLSMQDAGYDLSSHHSKSLDEIPQLQYDYVITMGCGDRCPHVAARHRYDWNIPDPKHMQMDEFNQVRDMIKHKVSELVASITNTNQ